MNAIALAPVEDFRRDSDIFGAGVREAAGAQAVKKERDGRLADQSRGLRPVLLDPRQVDVAR